jgi:RNA polymerase sigma-70 factor (ECF subfamily)
MAFLKFIHKKPADNFRDLPDEELIARYKTEDNNDLVGELYNRYIHLVTGLCYKYLKNEEDCRDAVMQVFEGLFTSLKQHEVANFKSWIYSVSKNHCLAVLRKKQGIYMLDTDTAEKFIGEFVEFADEVTLNSAFKNPDTSEQLMEAMNKLNHDQRTCIELFYLQDKSYKDVVEMTSYSMLQVKSFIQNGKRNLKIIMSNNHE